MFTTERVMCARTAGVRLILPRMVCDPITDADPYEMAAARLTRWRERGVLLTDERPGIYVYQYGDERFSRRIARKIVEVRQQRPIERARELDSIIDDLFAEMQGARGRRQGR